MKKEFYGKVDNKDIYKYTIENHSIRVSVSELGATVTELFVPTKNGCGDIAVGFANAEDYKAYSDNQGATIGRYANRIKNGKFKMDGKEYSCPTNDGAHTLHGNNEFREAIWTLTESGDDFLEFSYTSPDGANGFPGKLTSSVRFTVNDSALEITYDAVSDKKTPICLTNHLYFNLTCDPSKTVYSHLLQIDASNYTEADDELIPTGKILPVADTALDFRKPKEIGADILNDDVTVKAPGGYDVNFCLDGYDGSLKKVACMSEQSTGIEMSVYTDLPGLQLYSGNFLTPLTGKNGVKFCRHGAVCLETQYYPDTPNHPDFPQCFFEAGEHFKSKTVYKFSLC